jgi:hypothetical protein
VYRPVFFHALLSGVLASIAGIIYDRIYHFATETEFETILNPWTISAICIATCLVAGVAYWILVRNFGEKGKIVFHFAFSVGSFAMVIVPISITLPLSISYPELFPGLAVPMVFFPALAWFTTKPLFVMEGKPFK